MGKGAAAAAAETKKRKKKGRPSLLDLQKRNLKQQEEQQKEEKHPITPNPNSNRRSTRHNPASDLKPGNNEDDDDDERKEKKVKPLVRLPPSVYLNSASEASDSNADGDKPEINHFTHRSAHQVRNAEVPLIGFNGAPVWPLGRVFLPVVVGSKTLSVEFIVVNVPSPYNAILGRTWLHGMQAIASTYHQVVRFIGANGRQEDLRGDQVASKKCYVSAIHNSTKAKQVQWVEVPDMVIIEDVGQKAEDKAKEDLIQMPVNEDGSRFFLLGSSLSNAEREEMFSFLKANMEVFAWTPNEMPGVDPNFKVGKQSSKRCETYKVVRRGSQLVNLT